MVQKLNIIRPSLNQNPLGFHKINLNTVIKTKIKQETQNYGTGFSEKTDYTFFMVQLCVRQS